MNEQPNIARRAARSRRREGSRRIAAASLATLAVGIVGSVLVFSGPSVNSDLPPTTPAANSADGDGAESSETISEALDETDAISSPAPLVTVDVFLSRDPFEPVVPEPVVAAVDDPTDGTVTAPDPDAPNAPGEPVPPRLPGDPTAPSCTGELEVVCDGQVVTLINVGASTDGEPVAAIQVDAVVYEVTRGQSFAGSYLLAAIDGKCVSVLYGDDGFQLCSGQTVLK